MAVAGCSSAASSAAPAGTTITFAGAAAPAGSSAYPNGDLANTRDATGSEISSTNVASLKEAWTFKLPGAATTTGVSPYGSLAAAPIVVNGVVYLQDLHANVYAIALATGKLKWEYQANLAEKSGPGPDGVAVANGVVYGDTSTAVFALSAATGKVVWNDGNLLNSGQGAFEIQPAVAGGRVYLASAYGSGPGGGVILALDAATGKELWSFNTVTGAAPGAQALGVGSGGAWETPLVGTDGSVTFGIGNPYQSIGEAISHPSQQLYTDSEVNLSAATGKLRWYYQAVPNDFKDYDMQLSPIAATAGGVPAVIGGGKMGYVYAMNASTGALLWKTPVGAHDGPRQRFRAAARAQDHHQGALHVRARVVRRRAHQHGRGGRLGVPGHDRPAAHRLDAAIRRRRRCAQWCRPAGEIEALSLATGKVEWDTKVPNLPLGAATVSNDLVFTTLYNGELLALNRSTGAIVYQRSCRRRPTPPSPSPATRSSSPQAARRRQPLAGAARSWSRTPCADRGAARSATRCRSNLHLGGDFFRDRVNRLVKRVAVRHPGGGLCEQERQELPRRQEVGDQGVDDLAESRPAAGDPLLGVGHGPRPPFGVDNATR